MRIQVKVSFIVALLAAALLLGLEKPPTAGAAPPCPHCGQPPLPTPGPIPSAPANAHTAARFGSDGL